MEAGSSMTISSTSSGGSDYVAGSEGESRVMSERVQQLAATIYKEFERMIQRYDEECVKQLMPLVVNVLEQLDMACLEKEEHEVELELLREDNEQLVTQYEREKQLRRNADQSAMEVQDHFEGEQKELRDKVESLESIVRMLELKSKNSSDHSSRLEERAAELKEEYGKLHERYNELLKTHMDYMERAKWLIGADKFDAIANAAPEPGPRPNLNLAIGGAAAGAKQVSDILTEPGIRHRYAPGSSAGSSQMPTPAASVAEMPQFQNLSDEMQDLSDELSARAGSLSSPRDETPRKRAGRASSALSAEFQSDDALGADLTGGLVDPAEFASAGMGKEVENLIRENTELLETKNALNVVKNDLITRVDELSSEQEILREEIRSLELVRAKMGERINELETEMKKTQEELEALKRAREEEEDVPLAQRKRFTRVEMARVLMERNQYKEKFMELQDSVRWADMIRQRASSASMHGGRRKRGLWDFFSNLFNASDKPPPNGSSGSLVRYAGGASTVIDAAGRNSDPLLRKKLPVGDKGKEFLDTEYVSEKRMQERREQYKLVKAHVKKDESGRLQAYGWSIPAAVENKQNQLSVPVPVYCRPLLSSEPNLKIWCASGVALYGGRTPDGGYIVGESVFYSKPAADKPPPPQTSVDKLEKELDDQRRDVTEAADADWRLSSLVWVCSSAHGRSRVAVIDAANPADVFDSFDVCDSHILCVATIPGAKESDYASENDGADDPLGAGKAVAAKVVADSEASVDEPMMESRVSWCALLAAGDGVNFASAEAPPTKTGSPSKSIVA